MTVEIKPEDEQIIAEKLRSGAFRSVDELIHHAIAALASAESRPVFNRARPEGEKSLAQLFAESPFKGLAMDFERFPDTSSDL